MKKIFCLMLLTACLCMAGCGEEASSVPNSPTFDVVNPDYGLTSFTMISADGSTTTPIVKITFDVAVPKSSLTFTTSINGVPVPTTPLSPTVIQDGESGGKAYYVIFGDIGRGTDVGNLLTFEVIYDVPDSAFDLIWTSTTTPATPVYTGPFDVSPI